MSQQKFTCEENKKRLDVFLKEQLQDFTRTKIQKAIKNNSVMVNGEVNTTVHHFLEEGDIVEINIEEIQVKKKIDDGSVDFKVYYEDDSILVIEKPAGVIVHQFGDQPEYSLADEIVKRYPDVAGVGEDPIRPGIVHRIDKNVSGLMVIARTQQAFEHLKNQFKNREVEKEYIVLVDGKVENHHGTIDFRVGRSGSSKNRMAAFPANSEQGKDAVSHYEVIGHYKNKSLLKIKIETGRTHQIRVHMQAFGHLVIGDNVYSKKGTKHDLGRIFLHSAFLQFKHPISGKMITVNSTLPLELKQYLNAMTGHHTLILVSGPSGAGKTTLIDALLQKNPDKFSKPTTYTTRAARSHEEKIMFNVSHEEFEQRKNADEFLEWAEYNGNYYATHRQSLVDSLKAKPMVMNIEVQGAWQIMQKMPEVYSIFIDVENLDILRRRLKERGDLTDEQIEERIIIAQNEYQSKPLYDVMLVNTDGKMDEMIDTFTKKIKDLL